MMCSLEHRKISLKFIIRSSLPDLQLTSYLSN
jgi:hypothetical protein